MDTTTVVTAPSCWDGKYRSYTIAPTFYPYTGYTVRVQEVDAELGTFGYSWGAGGKSINQLTPARTVVDAHKVALAFWTNYLGPDIQRTNLKSELDRVPTTA